MNKKNPHTRPFSMAERWRSFHYAWRGLVHAFRITHNFYIHAGIATLVILLAFYLNVSRLEWAVLILCIGLVSAAEALNTAIEELVNLLHPQRDDRAGRIKDMAAGAVLICAVCAALAGLLILLPPLLASLFT